jgi:hypothetical protein
MCEFLILSIKPKLNLFLITLYVNLTSVGMSIRSLSLQSQFEYEFGSFSINPNAIIVADINDDNVNR